MHVFRSMQDVLAAEGLDLGTSDWRSVPQERIDRFAEATDDHQWIHVDVARAADGPYGTAIAHGYLTLSMIPAMIQELVTYEFGPARVNYGLDRVRFLAPVPAGARIRDAITIATVEPSGAGARVTFDHRVEIDSVEKPACVARTLSLIVPT